MLNVFARLALVVFGVAVGLGGCGKPRPATDSASDFQARLDAALEISNMSTRDDALAALAVAAAEAGDGEVTLGAVQGISNMSTKDDAAARAAVQLSGTGQEKAAVEVARQISNLSTRDATLQAIAEK